MDLNNLDLDLFMSNIGSSNVTIMLKIDAERQHEQRRPWTVFLEGEPLGSVAVFRSDCRSLQECIDVAVRELDRALGSRLGVILESAASVNRRASLLAADIEDLFGELADRGTTVMVQVVKESEVIGNANWSLTISGAAIRGHGIQTSGNNLEESLKNGLRELRATSVEWDWLDLYL